MYAFLSHDAMIAAVEEMRGLADKKIHKLSVFFVKKKVTHPLCNLLKIR